MDTSATELVKRVWISVSVTRHFLIGMASLLILADLAGFAELRADGESQAPISEIQQSVPEIIFKHDPTDNFLSSLAPIRPASPEPRTSSWGNGHIVIADPGDFPRIRALDYHAPGRLWDNMRPNLFGQEVPDEWDFTT